MLNIVYYQSRGWIGSVLKSQEKNPVNWAELNLTVQCSFLVLIFGSVCKITFNSWE